MFAGIYLNETRPMKGNPHDEFLRYYEPVHLAFVRYCASHAYGIIETQDLVQDAVLATMKSFRTIRDKEKLLPFMISVANNIVKARLRRNKFDIRLSESQMKNIEANVADPAVRLDIQYLYRALSQLSLQDKEAVLLFEVSGFSMREVAGIQRITEGAARVRIHRARHKLREILTAEGATYEKANGKSIFYMLF